MQICKIRNRLLVSVAVCVCVCYNRTHRSYLSVIAKIAVRDRGSLSGEIFVSLKR